MQQPTPALREDVERPFIGTLYIDYDETHYSRKRRTDARLKSVKTVRRRLISLFYLVTFYNGIEESNNILATVTVQLIKFLFLAFSFYAYLNFDFIFASRTN